MSTLKIEHIANIANSGPDISIDTSGHLNIVNGSLQMGGTTMLDTSDTTLKNVSKIGIGTASPGYKLHLHENSSSESYQLFTNSTTGATTSDGFRIGIDSNENALIWHREAKIIQFATSNDIKMVILANGNVGIGTTSPVEPLHVQFSNNTGADTGIVIKNTNTGTTANFAGLQTQAVNGAVLGTLASADYDAWGVGTFAGSQSNHPTYLIANNAVKMTILANGNVGIGTNNPHGNLHIHGDNTRTIFGPVTANLAAQHRLEFWEGAPTNSTDAHYAIEYDGTTTYGGDGAFLFRGYGSAANQVFGGINRQGTAFFGMNGASPRVGIGTTTPNAKLHVFENDSTAFSPSSSTWHNIVVSNENTSGTARTAGIAFELNGYHANAGTGIAAVKNGTASDYGADLAFITRPQSLVAEERMRIDSAGNVLFGCVAQPSGSTGGSGFMNSTHGRRNLWLALTSTADNSLVIFANPNGIVGQIRCSGSVTNYITTSDRRLKENIIPIQDASQKILAMNPVSHTWINDKTAPEQHGFIAQEMQSIVPEAVSGDANSEEMMGMDYGKITPVIVKSLQDALNEISSLKQRISELEKN